MGFKFITDLKTIFDLVYHIIIYDWKQELMVIVG